MSGMTSFLLSLLPDLQGLYLIPAELTQAIIIYFYILIIIVN